MADYSTNSKRIAKNTVLLYFRTFFVMLISIYTSRIVLEALGVEDYGVYQVVGGMVAMFSIITNALSASISRYITFELGNGNIKRLNKIFSTSRAIQYVLSIIIIVLAEIVGLWFMHNHMQIPDGRMDAAVWVLHFSVVSFVFTLLSVPYNACIIAHEHMRAFAYISIFDALLRLIICFLLLASPIDRLIFYGLAMMSLSALMRVIYNIYCWRYFDESRVKVRFYKSVFNEMFGFAGWNFLTSACNILNVQGVNMLINVFFGVTFNAARGLANQVKNALVSFVSSFTTAINPQITKSYAAGSIDEMHSLVCRGARFSYYLILLMAVPIFFEAETILDIWLKTVPEKTVVFVRLSLINVLIDGAGYTSYTANLATGKIKKYSITLSLITVLVFPLVWVAFSLGASVEMAYYIDIVGQLLYQVSRLFLTQENVGLKVSRFIKDVYFPIIITTFLSILPSLFVVLMVDASIWRLILSTIVGLFTVSVMILVVGMKKDERDYVTNIIKGRLLAFLNKQ